MMKYKLFEGGESTNCLIGPLAPPRGRAGGGDGPDSMDSTTPPETGAAHDASVWGIGESRLDPAALALIVPVSCDDTDWPSKPAADADAAEVVSMSDLSYLHLRVDKWPGARAGERSFAAE